MIQDSYNDSPTLYLVPTPIGNLDDITYRSVKVLNDVKVIFSEDTRVTRQLLTHLHINKKLYQAHEHNEDIIKEKVLSYLNDGYSIALVTDRGTPIISDPGYKCSKYAIENGYNVVSLPGATALIPALTVSGLEPYPFVFYGFLNSKPSKRDGELLGLKTQSYTMIFYESPHRILETLKAMLNIFGDRQICIAREISKKYEHVYRGTISTIIELNEDFKGEIVIVVEGDKTVLTYDHISVIEHVNLYIKEGMNEMDAIKRVAKDRHQPKNIVYKDYHS